MAFLSVKDGFILVTESYPVRELCMLSGCSWDANVKAWKMAFTLETFERLITNIPDIRISEDVFPMLEKQKEKETKLIQLRDLKEVTFKIKGLKREPYPYQKVGILYSMLNGTGVLIGDEMGLGKTLQAIGIAVGMKSKGLIKNCLVVTPASLKWNWPKEIESSSDERYVVIDNKDPEKRLSQWLDEDCFFKIVNYELAVEDLFGVDRKSRQPVGTSLTEEQKKKKIMKLLRKKKLDELKRRGFDLMVLDECHGIKNFKSSRSKLIREIRAKMKIGLSGTPMDGKPQELYTIMNILAPGILDSPTAFHNEYVIKDIYGAVKGYKNIDQLRNKIAPFFIRRKKIDVLDQLPEKIHEDKFISLTDAELKIYKQIKEGTHPCVIDDDKNVAEPAVIAIRCLQFCNFPQMIDPDCRASTKIDIFKELVEELVQLNGQKIIVFMQYKQILDVIDQVLRDMNVNFLRIDGDTDKKVRVEYQAVFNNDPKIDCIIGTDAMSTGLNLTGGDTVINYMQAWTPSTMLQREDRSHRIGRKGNVTVVNLMARDTIEERIRNVLYSKNKITDETLDGTNVFTSLTKKQIQELL